MREIDELREEVRLVQGRLKDALTVASGQFGLGARLRLAKGGHAGQGHSPSSFSRGSASPGALVGTFRRGDCRSGVSHVGHPVTVELWKQLNSAKLG